MNIILVTSATARARSITLDWRHWYGKILEIDHGKGLVSRGAHASQLAAVEGDLMVRGRRVASVGSTGVRRVRTCISKSV